MNVRRRGPQRRDAANNFEAPDPRIAAAEGLANKKPCVRQYTEVCKV